MFAPFEHGRIFSKIIIAWILCSRGNACPTKPPKPAMEVPKTTPSPTPEVQQKDIKTIPVGGKGFYWIGGRTRDWKHWPQARDWCKSRGGNLATHLTEHQMEKIVSHLPRWAPIVWVGAHMRKTTGESDWKESYKWVKPSYAGGHGPSRSISGTDGLWRYNSPKGDQCMAMERWARRKDGKGGPAYRDFMCNSLRFSFICEGICTWCRSKGSNITDPSSTETAFLY